ncbi:uncharacterized protein RMCN_1346 [Mycolicibacterium novocastrense]|uniref:Uncharacterized protein n=1 Tax=Mycolicibacterium novocastrense TaxID=59813 RepID=A0ABQ0KG60_MYCNV|nr:uncharacterized protein RMCN_1346 [Mycolicibacterium novocastrense]
MDNHLQAGNRPAPVADNRPPAGVADTRPATEEVGNPRAEAGAGNPRPAAVADTRREVEAGCFPVAGVVDQSCDLPG